LGIPAYNPATMRNISDQTRKEILGELLMDELKIIHEYLKDLPEMKQDIQQLKEDVAVLKADMKVIKAVAADHNR